MCRSNLCLVVTHLPMVSQLPLVVLSMRRTSTMLLVLLFTRVVTLFIVILMCLLMWEILQNFVIGIWQVKEWSSSETWLITLRIDESITSCSNPHLATKVIITLCIPSFSITRQSVRDWSQRNIVVLTSSLTCSESLTSLILIPYWMPSQDLKIFTVSLTWRIFQD